MPSATQSWKPSREAAALECLRRRRGRESLIGYANAIPIPGKPASDDPDEWLFQPVESGLAAHHLLILQAIERAASRRYGRFMLFLPPGSAKSTYGSVVAPTFFMGKRPGTKIILASYGTDLARKHGRRARQIVRSPEYGSLFDTGLTRDSSAAHEWALTNGSEYLAAGLMAGLTGNRAHGALVDDPIKGREQADSPTIRAKTWDAYMEDLQTRLIPGGWIGLIQCMTGDTPVLMADGSEKPLRDVRPGDTIASHSEGRLVASTVLNWASQGPDRVLAIKTSSGIIVRANERHPFLVARAEGLEWVRVKSLKIGDKILRASTGGSGGASSALQKGATCQQSAEGSAARITTSICGRPGTDRHRSTPTPEGTLTCGTVTASTSANTNASWPLRAVSAPSAGSRQGTTCERTGAGSCASTTAMTPARCEACCATTAISPSDTGRPRTRSFEPLSTYELTPDPIVEIVECGTEEVFDIQVEGTENFIANGLVSHNTRWHEDDLAGRLLPKGYDGRSGMVQCTDGRMWEVINIPAMCERTDDPLGRQIGEYLWPEWFDASHWAPFQAQSRTWASLFQQRPRPDDGGVFKESWCRNRYQLIPHTASTVIHSWDTAQKEQQKNDPSVMTAWRFGQGQPGYYLADVFRDRLVYPDLKRKVLALAERDHPTAILIEDKSSGQSLIQELRATTTLPIIAIEPEGSKFFRASEVSAMVEAGLVILPYSSPWISDYEGELFAFPLSVHDDQVDSTSQFLAWVRQWAGSIEFEGAGMPRALAEQLAGRENQGDSYGGWSRGTDLDGFN